MKPTFTLFCVLDKLNEDHGANKVHCLPNQHPFYLEQRSGCPNDLGHVTQTCSSYVSERWPSDMYNITHLDPRNLYNECTKATGAWNANFILHNMKAKMSLANALYYWHHLVTFNDYSRMHIYFIFKCNSFQPSNVLLPLFIVFIGLPGSKHFCKLLCNH